MTTKQVTELLSDLPGDLVRKILKERDEKRNTALHYAVQMGHSDICRLFCREGAKIEEKGQDGLTPSQFAARYSCQENATYIWHSLKCMVEEKEKKKEVVKEKEKIKKKKGIKETIEGKEVKGLSWKDEEEEEENAPGEEGNKDNESGKDNGGEQDQEGDTIDKEDLPAYKRTDSDGSRDREGHQENEGDSQKGDIGREGSGKKKVGEQDQEGVVTLNEEAEGADSEGDRDSEGGKESKEGSQKGDIGKEEEMIDQGGDREHEDHYMELLTFAAIAGNLPLCQLLSRNGEKLDNAKKKKLIQTLVDESKESKKNWVCIDWIVSLKKNGKGKDDLKLLLKSKWYKERTRAFHRHIKQPKPATVSKGTESTSAKKSVHNFVEESKAPTGDSSNAKIREPNEDFEKFLPPDLRNWPKFLVQNAVKSKDGRGNTALHYAARTGNVDLCTFLVSQEAKKDEKGQDDLTPLQFAALYGVAEFPVAAWDKICTILGRKEKKKGSSLLHFALQNPNWVTNATFINKLIDSKTYDITSKDEHGNNCLHLAVKFNTKAEHGVLKNFLKEINPKVLKQCLQGINNDGATPFHVAIADRNHASLETLCMHVQQIDGLNLESFLQSKPSSSDKPSPIQLAVNEDNFRVVDVLMSYDLDLTTARPHLDITK